MAYRHLAAEGAWPGLRLDGLSVDDHGRLGLAPLADPSVAVSSVIDPVPGLEGPAGIAVDAEGNIYVSDPVAHRILRLDGCGGEFEPLPCVRGPGDRPGQVDTPRGLAIDRNGRLWVADSGNGRLQAWDLATGQVVGIWSGPWPDGQGGMIRLHEPWDLAADAAGYVYVADPGQALLSGARRDGRVLRFTAAGTLDHAFMTRMAAGAETPGSPTSVSIAASSNEEGDRLLVLDQQPARLLAFGLDGAFDPATTSVWVGAAGLSEQAQAISFLDGRLYVGTPGGGTLAFDFEGQLVGTVGDSRSSSAGIAVDCEGRLLVHPGGGGSILRAQGAPTFRACGRFTAGPFSGPLAPTHWQRIRLDLEPDESAAHIRIFTLTSDTLDGTVPERTPALFPDCSTAADVLPLDPGDPVGARWVAAPVDADDLFIQSEPGAFLWIVGVFRGDRRSTPLVRQLRLDHDRPGWISHLPALYSRDPVTRVNLDRFLTLFETIHEDAHDSILDLPALFDPEAAEDTPGGSGWLDWLATWVGVTLSESWGEERRRAVVGGAFRAQARRGTVGYLQEMLWLHADVRARVIEGAASSDVWVLGVSPLGRETRPAAYPAQGAVLDTTATVDHSHINGSGRYGAELFDESVHCLFVHVYRSDLRTPDALDRVRRVLDDEVPAHMVYRLCVIEPALRVGHQGQVGIDAIVAGPPQAHVTDTAPALGSSFVLRPPRGPHRTVPEPTRVGTRIH